MAYTEAELLRIRMDCLFTCEAGRMLYVNEPWRQTVPAPLLHVGRTLGGEICYRFGQQVSPSAMSGAQAMLESGVWDADAYGKVLGGSRSKREICFWYPGKQVPAADCHALVSEEAPLLSATFPGYEEELPFASPYMACFRNGQIVSICRSVRMGQGHEAGIATLPAYRRQGCALEALRSWTAAVLEQGIIPLYSTDLHHAASRGLASKGGFVPYAQTLEIWL